jgi:hypothetical protein
LPPGHPLTRDQSNTPATVKNRRVARSPTARRIINPRKAEIRRRSRHSREAARRIRNAVAKAVMIPILGQPDASAEAGIQRLVPTAVPAMAPAFQQNRFDVVEVIVLSTNPAPHLPPPGRQVERRMGCFHSFYLLTTRAALKRYRFCPTMRLTRVGRLTFAIQSAVPASSAALVSRLI